MRNEQEMLELILEIAQNDDNIRAIYMNGSRTNPNVASDKYQDYDIVYVVNDTLSYVYNEQWINQFGSILIKQEPDKLDLACGKDINFSVRYAYLMLFDDGNRIDLTLIPKDRAIENYQADSLTKLLLDKDKLLPTLPDATDEDYWVKAPNEALYNACCNEFWWCLQNVAKGIWREELPYAKEMFDTIVRPQLDAMADWWIGNKTSYQISTGKMGKYREQFFPTHLWEIYEQTYSDANFDNFWKAIFAACHLFRTLAKDVGTANDYTYPVEDDEAMMLYIQGGTN